MSKIMCRGKDSIYGWFDLGPSEILRLGKDKNKATKARELLNDNQKLLRRILDAKPEFDAVALQAHTLRNEDLKMHM